MVGSRLTVDGLLDLVAGLMRSVDLFIPDGNLSRGAHPVISESRLMGRRDLTRSGAS